MDEPKFCKDCKHYTPPHAVWGVYCPDYCRHPRNMSEPDLVSGRSHALSMPEEQRKPDANCGEKGRWFERAEPEPEPHPSVLPVREERNFWQMCVGLILRA